MSLMEKHKANPYLVVKESGIAPLHFAVCMTNEKSAVYFTKYFLKHNGSFNQNCQISRSNQINSMQLGDTNVKTEDGETSLHIACYYGRLKIVELLVVSLSV